MGLEPSSKVEALLTELCVRYGYCLPPERTRAMIDDPPDDADAFVDAVLDAEGLPQDSLDRKSRRVLTDTVTRWLFNEGVQSEHPLPEAAESDKTTWVEQLPRGESTKDSLARLIEFDHDEAEVSLYEAAADPQFERMERQRRTYREMFRRKLRHLQGRRGQP